MPPLPNYYLERRELNALEHLILEETRTVALVGKSSGVGVQGMGGIGKSVLATALAHSPAIQEAFPDGIVWLNIGQSPDLKEQQSIIIDSLGGETIVFEKATQGKRHLDSFLRHKSCLIILDDVWNLNHANAFNLANSKSRLLITTRDADIVSRLGAFSFTVKTLSDKQAYTLLRQSSEFRQDRSLPPQAKEITKECGNLPLAIAMVGAMLRNKPHRRWQQILQRLQNSELEKIKKAFVDYPYPNLFKAIHVSVEDLEPQIQERYLDFAVFPEDYAIPEAVLETLWADEDLGGDDPTDVIDLLLDKSLLQRRGKSDLILHDLQYDYVRKQTSNKKALHAKLIQAYRNGGSESSWEHIEDDGYYRKFIVYHLKMAGDENGAKEAAKALLLRADNLSPTEAYECFKVLNGRESEEVMKHLVKRDNIHVDVTRHALRELGSEIADDAKKLIKKKDQHPAIVLECLNILEKDATEEAKTLIGVESQNIQVILQCLSVLGSEAKEEAKKLLQESTDVQVIRRCLDVLGPDARDFARSLIKESNDPQVLLNCLKILGEEAKQDIPGLIRRKDQNFEVIRKCLALLNQDDVSDLKWLLRNYSTDTDIALKCLELLGEEAKAEAKLLLKRSKNAQVIAKSVKVLGAEVSDFVHSLLEENNDLGVLLRYLEILSYPKALDEKAKWNVSQIIRKEQQSLKVIKKCLVLLDKNDVSDLKWLLRNYGIHAGVALECLRLLGEKAKTEAKPLLERSNNAHVIAKSVEILGAEALDFSIEKLTRWRKVDPILLPYLFQVAMNTPEAERASKEMLREWHTLSTHLKALALSLPTSKASTLKMKYAKEVLLNWKAKSRLLVHASLVAFEEKPEEVEFVCRSILQNWHRDVSYQIERKIKRFDSHIVKALSHPLLESISIAAADDMLLQEKTSSLSLTQELRTAAKGINQGVWPLWRTDL